MIERSHGFTRHYSRMPEAPAEVRVSVQRLSELAQLARKDAEMTVDEVAAAIHSDRSVVSRVNSGGWLTEGLSKETLTAMFNAMHAADETVAEAERLYDEVATWKRQARRASRQATDLSPVRQLVRFGWAASQPPSRPYASIDRIALSVFADGRVEGTIERVEPASRRGALWNCAGYITHRSLHITFWPSDAQVDDRPQSDSIGQVAIQRQPSRKQPWQGFLTKLEHREGKKPRLSQFKYALSPSEDRSLIHAASSVAVIDFDNTLADGWILGPWLDVLAEAGIGHAAEASRRLERAIAEYAEPDSFGHDRLATEAAEIYAYAVAGVQTEEVTRHAAAFVADYVSEKHGRIFRHSRSLLDGLCDRGLRPILVSGAPREVVDHLMLELDVRSSFPLLLERENGRFTGQIEFNHGLSSGKYEACQLLEARECELLVAIGDSEGDRPMWQRAACSIQVGSSEPPVEITIPGVDLRQPLDDDFWARIPRASWTDDVWAADR